MAEGAGNPEDVHRVKVAANNALDLRGAVFRRDVARGDAALGGSGCRLGGGRWATFDDVAQRARGRA